MVPVESKSIGNSYLLNGVSNKPIEEVSQSILEVSSVEDVAMAARNQSSPESKSITLVAFKDEDEEEGENERQESNNEKQIASSKMHSSSREQFQTAGTTSTHTSEQ